LTGLEKGSLHSEALFYRGWRMSRVTRYSYCFVLGTFVLAGWLHLATPLLTVLFSFFALERLNFSRNKTLTIVLFLTLVAGIFYGFVFFVREAVTALPDVLSRSIPAMLRFAEEQKIALPFDDLDSLKSLVLDHVKEQLGALGNFAKLATKEFAFLLIGLVVGVSLFVNATLDLERGTHTIKNNLYALLCEGVVARFSTFYHSFAQVMGAQLIIATINATLTALFLFSVGFPYASVVIGVTWLCGMFPIIGNLISNTVIVCIAFTISPRMAMAALVFLIVLHKLEYFLNSKIIGERIKTPMWLTLLGLVVGERLMGIPGMILAPVVLDYIKDEAKRIKVAEAPAAEDAAKPVD
jgi:predicted PurR-regulated permease PerM